jgi:hypothetical protein
MKLALKDITVELIKRSYKPGIDCREEVTKFFCIHRVFNVIKFLHDDPRKIRT